ncbi:hypothetical protein DQG13_29845 [Paenibacillus sp. YN15]|nr:hypothetical protein DQG13_29845 [Paenibacillus sp. YN15]
MRIKNPYYFIAGVLAVLFAATHAWNGQAAVLPKLDIEAVSVETQTVFTYVWHIITVENLVFGITFMILSIQNDPLKGRLAALMIVSVLFVRLIVILGATAILDASSLGSTFTDSIAIIIYIALIILGIRLKGRPRGGRPPQSGKAL